MISPIWLPGIKEITELVARKTRQYTCYPVKVCKRDISNAFRRVPLHPDYVAIFVTNLRSVRSD